jgi:hypothetical protein
MNSIGNDERRVRVMADDLFLERSCRAGLESAARLACRDVPVKRKDKE